MIDHATIIVLSTNFGDSFSLQAMWKENLVANNCIVVRMTYDFLDWGKSKHDAKKEGKALSMTVAVRKRYY